MDKRQIPAKIGEICSRIKEVDVAYVFGSFLLGKKFNDIDVALLLSKDLDPYTNLKFAMRTAGELERGIMPRSEFDVKVLNSSPLELQFEVIRTGAVVFSRDEERRIDFESELISAYLDIKEMYEFLDREFLARV